MADFLIMSTLQGGRQDHSVNDGFGCWSCERGLKAHFSIFSLNYGCWSCERGLKAQFSFSIKKKIGIMI